jgi:hypothetical protein
VIEIARAILLPLWPALAGAFALGLAFGFAGWRERPAGFWGRLGVILVLLAGLGGVALAVLGRVPGRAGLWIELALAIAAAYLVGCVLGSTSRALWTRITRAAAPG